MRILLKPCETLVRSSEFSQLKVLLAKHGYVTLHVKDYWKDEPRSLREYSCNIEGMKLAWRVILPHYKFHHNEIYERFAQMVMVRDFTLHNDLVYERQEISVNQTITIELQKDEQRELCYIETQNNSVSVSVSVDVRDGVAYCVCGGHYINTAEDKKQHERTQMHQSYLQSLIPVPIYHH